MKEEEHRLQKLRKFLDSELIRVALSILIIISVLPEKVLPLAQSVPLSLTFFLIFAFEFSVRVAFIYPAFREGKASLLDLCLLGFDLVATLSFLPVEAFFPGAKGLRTLRLARLVRMLLLLRYWGAQGKEIWIILIKRRYQILFAASVVVVLTFVGGVVLANLEEYHAADQQQGEPAHDYNDDGQVDDSDSSFASIVWWSFRQVQDPGNLVREPELGVTMLVSMLLTIGGLFIISFIIGIGTNVVEELVAANRGRPIGMREHTAVLNVARHSYLLLHEVQSYYLKHFRKARVAVLGATENRPEYLYQPELRRVRYRSGRHGDVQDFRKVDADQARWTILLGNTDDPDSDASVISQILALRQLNPDGWIMAELFDEFNLGAVVEAGGRRTIPIPMRKLIGLFLTNLVLFPGIEDVYRELLTSAGHEVYTLVFGEGLVPPLDAAVEARPFEELYRIALIEHGVVLLGVLVTAEQEPGQWSGPYQPILNPEPGRVVDGTHRGFVALSQSFRELRDFAEAFAAGELSPAPPPPATRPSLPLMLCPEAFSLRKVLICGFHPGLVNFVEQIALFLRAVTIHIMVAGEAELGTACHTLVSHSRRRQILGQPTRGQFVEDAGDLVYRFADGPDPSVPIKVLVGDPGDERVLLDASVGGFTLADLDAIVFTPDDGAERNPDARTALGMLKLGNLHRSRPDLFKSSLRVIAEVADPERGDLLEESVMESWDRGSRCRTINVLSRERIRNQFVAQATFVPGIVPIYRQLLSESGEEICRLILAPYEGDRDEALEFHDLAQSLYDGERLMLLGVELLNSQGERCIHLNPRPGDPAFRFRRRDLIGVCAIGRVAGLTREQTGCQGCLRPH